MQTRKILTKATCFCPITNSWEGSPHCSGGTFEEFKEQILSRTEGYHMALSFPTLATNKIVQVTSNYTRGREILLNKLVQGSSNSLEECNLV